ncbi:MAG: DUF2142 domain-containing protein [Lachnospiraceae bacterium]|nr:DUF2142 domain-containing protein [Lachnospiraceae bacterium]
MGKRKFYKNSFLIVWFMLTIFGFIYIRGTRYASFSGDYNRSIQLNECLGEVNQYETSDGYNFVVQGDDPWILLDFSSLTGNGIRGVAIELNSSIALSSVKMFYGRESADFTELDKTVLEGQGSVIETNFPEAFKYLRLNISQDFGIASISIADDYKIQYKNVHFKYMCMLLINLLISALIAYSERFNRKLIKVDAQLKSFGKLLFINKLKVFIRVIIPFAIFILLFVCEYIFGSRRGTLYFNIYRVLVFTCIISILIFAYLYRNICMQYVHIYYFILVMSIGTCTILTIPAVAGTTWDDETHYSRTAVVSWGQNGLISYADNEVSYPYIFRFWMDESSIYKHEIREYWEESIDTKAEINPVLEKSENAGGLGATFVSYIPGAVGLVIGRGLGLSFTHTYMLGKWMNLLCYSALFSLSIKMVKERGKLLIAVIGMIPTSLCLASAYAYDWWVVSFVIFGYAMCIREVRLFQEIRMPQLVKILFIMVIGILPKAVYFPLLFPVMFMDYKKDKHTHVKRFAVVFAMVILIATFALPILFNGAGTGDTRGGEAVNSSEQIKYILNNPLQYTLILLKFLKTYLSPDQAHDYLTYMAYYGKAEYHTLCMLIIGVIAVIDNGKLSEKSRIIICQRCAAAAACFASMALAATALYVSFTPVGYDTVLGCQYRYILPVLFPFLYFIGKMDIDVGEKIKSNIFAIATTIMAIIFLYGLYSLRVCNF